MQFTVEIKQIDKYTIEILGVKYISQQYYETEFKNAKQAGRDEGRREPEVHIAEVQMINEKEKPSEEEVDKMWEEIGRKLTVSSYNFWPEFKQELREKFGLERKEKSLHICQWCEKDRQNDNPTGICNNCHRFPVKKADEICNQRQNSTLRVVQTWEEVKDEYQATFETREAYHNSSPDELFKFLQKKLE